MFSPRDIRSESYSPCSDFRISPTQFHTLKSKITGSNDESNSSSRKLQIEITKSSQCKHAQMDNALSTDSIQYSTIIELKQVI